MLGERKECRFAYLQKKKNEKLLKTSRQTGLEVQIGTTRIGEVEARGSWVQDSPELCFEVSSKNEIQQT